MTKADAKRLGEIVRARRKELKLTQADVQEAGGPSTATLRLIEGGRHVDFRPATATPLETILQWQAGSIDSLLNGDDPTPLQPGTATDKPLRAVGQTTSNFGKLDDLPNLLAAIDATTSALEGLSQVLKQDDADIPDETRAPLVLAWKKLGATIPLIVLSCELLGEALAAEDIGSDEDIADLASRLDKHAGRLDEIRTLAHRLSNALHIEENSHDLETETQSPASPSGNENKEDEPGQAPGSPDKREPGTGWGGLSRPRSDRREEGKQSS